MADQFQAPASVPGSLFPIWQRVRIFTVAKRKVTVRSVSRSPVVKPVASHFTDSALPESIRDPAPEVC